MSVLQTPEVRARFNKNYIGVSLDFGEIDDKDPRLDLANRFNPKKWRPVLVFLDAQGKEVYRHLRGLKSAKQALLLERYISERHYLKMDFQMFMDDQEE